MFPFDSKTIPNYVAPSPEFGGDIKSIDYAIHERQFQHGGQYAGLFGVKDPDIKWTSPEDYKRHVEKLYFECAVSRSCIDIRSDRLASVKVIVEGGSEETKALLTAPNTIDGTLGQAMRVWETELSLGGDLFLFLDQRVPGLPQLRTLRQDFIAQDPKNNQITYIPGRANGQGVPELRFLIEGGQTKRVEHSLDGKVWRPIKGHLFHIMRFNPLSSATGSGDGDAINRAVDIYIEAQKMVRTRFQANGRKTGFIKAGNLANDAEIEKFKATMAALNTGAGVTALADGADFVANAFSFSDLDILNIMRDQVRTIALAFGVPAVFMNLEGESSYAERRAADRIFYKSFVHPRATWLIEQIEVHLRRVFDPTIKLVIDKTQIDYVKEELGEEQERKSKLGIYTINELREIAGDKPLPEGGDVIPGSPAPAEAASSSGDPAVDAAVEAAVGAATGKPKEVGFHADSSRRPEPKPSN